jgi:anti-sigma28 factor (negative regulator of flagellin synthesis)
MKINMTPPVSRVEQYKVGRSKAAPGATRAGQTDQISFSGDATLFAETVKAARASIQERLDASEIDLDAIKGKIESGSYKVNAEELANSMMMLNGYYTTEDK